MDLIAAAAMSSPICTIDQTILNDHTIGQVENLGLAVFAKLCGVNRGAFVLDPPDGNTYSCLSFPGVFSTNVGLGWNDTIPDSATFTGSFEAGNITASQAVEVVDQYINAVYKTSAEGASSNPYGCDVGGLATLQNCTSPTRTLRSLRKDKDIVRAVTLSGAFIPSFATDGQTLTMDEVREFYTDKDFKEMVKLGVNTIQIPVPCDAFHDEDLAVELTELLNRAARAELSAIIVLVKSDVTRDKATAEVVDDHIKAAASYAKIAPAVIALQLPSSTPSLLSSVRSVASKLPILFPVNKGELGMVSFPPDKHVFAALDTDTTFSAADVASSDSVGDRMKMFYHESITCIDRSPIEWLSCYHDVPVYVTSGFDLAIDDCISQDEDNFKDYGQCDRFNETTGSDWWKRHRQSLAGRQLFTYSKGLGWSFSAWKLYGDDGSGNITPARLKCLRDVAAAGLLPPMENTNELGLGTFCLNGPVNDFVIGDETFAPTPAPVDCGNGWWNETIGDCSYWVPPPPTPAPTKESCPPCNGAGTKAITLAAAAGAVAALVTNLVVKKYMNGNRGYEVLP